MDSCSLGSKFSQDLAEKSCRKVEEKAINLFQIEDLAISRPDVGRKMKKKSLLGLFNRSKLLL